MECTTLAGGSRYRCNSRLNRSQGMSVEERDRRWSHFCQALLTPCLKLPQPQVIACNAVVGKVASKFLAQLLVLLRHRSVPIVPTPLR